MNAGAPRFAYHGIEHRRAHALTAPWCGNGDAKLRHWSTSLMPPGNRPTDDVVPSMTSVVDLDSCRGDRNELGIAAPEIIHHVKCVVIHSWECNGILAGHRVVERPDAGHMSHCCGFNFHHDNAVLQWFGAKIRDSRSNHATIFSRAGGKPTVAESRSAGLSINEKGPATRGLS